MTPIQFYQTAFLGKDKVGYNRFGSPFPIENAKVLIPNFISTKYRDRDRSLDDLCGVVLDYD